MSTVRQLLTAVVLLSARIASSAQGDVEILHDPIGCWPTDQFLFADSTFQPPADLQTAKLYFRSSLYPDYYFVEMTLGRNGSGRAILPMAEAQTPDVVYYVELVTKSFSAFRTGEMTVPVSSGSECQRQDPETAFYNGPNPDITLGATRAGVPQLAPGFKIDGIARFIDIAATSGGGGGGISGKTAGILAGTGGGAAVALAMLGGASETTSSAVGGVTTVTTTAGSTTTVTGGGPSTTTTTTGGGGGPTSTTTTTAGGGGSSSTTTTVAGPTTTTTGGPSTTTTTGGPSTTTSSGSSTTTSVGSSTTTSAGSSTTTSVGSSTTSSAASSSTSSTTSTAATTSSTTTTTAAATADLSISKSASSPRAAGQPFTYTITVTNNGPANATSVIMTDTYPASTTGSSASPECNFQPGNQLRCVLSSLASGASKNFQLTVVPNSNGTLTNYAEVISLPGDPVTGNNSVTISSAVPGFLGMRAEQTTDELEYRTGLDVVPKEPAVRGRIVVDQKMWHAVDSTGPRQGYVAVGPGRVVFEAHVEPGARARGTWFFDFSGSSRVVRGSIRAESGVVSSLDGDSIVFAIEQDSPPFRFSIELR